MIIPAPDKLAHCLGGAIITAIVMSIVIAIGLSPDCALLIALFFVVGVGVGKEVYDLLHRDRHTPEVADALWTIGGGLIPAAPFLVFFVLKAVTA